MKDEEFVHRTLSAGASLLDRAAMRFAGVGLDARVNVERIGRALAEVFEVLSDLQRLYPDLTPPQLQPDVTPESHAEENRRLTRCFYEASGAEHAGRFDDAIACFEVFLTVTRSELHREIAIGEIKRLRGREAAESV